MNDRIAIVTGAARGVGRAVATTLAARGATVVAVDIDPDGLADVVEEVTGAGGHGHAAVTDLRDIASIEAMVDETVSRHGRVDLLANNAGMTLTQDLFDVTGDDWDHIHSLNSRGLFFCMQAVARHMVDQGSGSIVNMASIASLGYRQTTSIAYSASKGSVLVMSQVAAHALAGSGVRVNAVCPGPTHTEFAVRETWAAQGRGELPPEKLGKLYANLDSLVPIGRANTPEDVAELVAFLLSDQARTITGSSYVIDGGIMLR